MPTEKRDFFFKEGLKILREAHSMTQAGLADKAGVQRVAISQIETGARPASKEAQWALAGAFNLSPEMVIAIGERGTPLEPQPKDFRPISVDIKLFGNVDKNILSKDIPLTDYYAAPLVSGQIAAGSGAIVEEEIKSLVWIYAPALRTRRRHNLVAVQLAKDANSMKPTLFPGDIVLIDRDEPQSASEFKSGKIYAVRLKKGEDDCAIKRVHKENGNLIIFSDNRKYPPQNAYTGDVKELIVGRVVWGWRNLLEV